jgi:hypothetical protein
VAGILVTLVDDAGATTFTAKSVSFADVRSAIALARDGDTIMVPAGTASWASTLVISKSITLQGATTFTGSPGNPTVTDATIIQDNIARTSANYGGVMILFHNLVTTQSVRLTGFTFKTGTVTTKCDNGAIQIAGICPSVRMDHCHFDRLHSGPCAHFTGWIYGVFDHCKCDMLYRGPAVRSSYGAWNNQRNGWGSWADYPYFGSEKFIFIEDNLIINLNSNKTPNYGGIDADTGGRFVARHNTFINGNIFYHGTDTGAGGAYKRGTRAVEIYNNTFSASFPSLAPGQNRGGSLLWHDNTYTGTYKGGMTLRPYRTFEYEGKLPLWAGADGTSPWDYNATEAGGTHVDGHAPYTYATGTHVGANNSKTVMVSGTPWTNNQWAGYSVTNTNRSSPYFHGHNYISSNTSNTLTLEPIIASSGPPGKFNTGDTFAIHKVLIILDQPGRGKGDLLNSNPTPAWPHQALEPCYSWNNTMNGSNLNFSNKDSANILRANRDYYDQTNSFDGTVGVGVGTLADRPATCTPGVAYWATDQGKWDSTHSGPDGQLYVCTASNTWTLKYKPYVYPHPLTTARAKPGSRQSAKIKGRP